MSLRIETDKSKRYSFLSHTTSSSMYLLTDLHQCLLSTCKREDTWESPMSKHIKVKTAISVKASMWN